MIGRLTTAAVAGSVVRPRTRGPVVGARSDAPDGVPDQDAMAQHLLATQDLRPWGGGCH